MPLDLDLLDRRLARLRATRPDLFPALKAEARLLRAAYQREPVVRPPLLPPARVRAKLERGVPLLHGEELFLDLAFGGTVLAHVGALLDAGAPVPAAPPRVAWSQVWPDLPQILGEGLVRHEDHLRELAGWSGVDPALFVAVATRAAAPILQAYAERLAPALEPDIWGRGYCPICGGWPGLLERSALLGAEALRCLSCGSAWRLTPRRCPLCADREFRTVHAEPGGERDGLSLEYCRRCRHFLPGRAVTEPTPTPLLSLELLAAARLDGVAAALDLKRPSGVGFRLELSPAPASSEELEEREW